jgi:ABC-type multidrug transport system fused ATPase/permease subunit
MARVDKFLSRMPKQYDTVIGERGIRLSGGERQRVGIARALIKDPKILIFDEATSNLDTTNEKEIREAIKKASEGRTTIIIAHRFSTIKDADRIIVFEEGKIAGIGTHEALVKNCPAYQRLVKDQVFV